MKIGIFDSGLGGLVIAQSLFKAMPKHDFVYFGDTKHLPYGNKKPTQIYKYTLEAVQLLFKNDCQLVILACNTASALALRKIQQEYLPKSPYFNRRVLGVIIPTLEVADAKHKRKTIGVIGTNALISSHIYKKELSKIDSNAKVYEIKTPKLVNLIEQNALPEARNALRLYLKQLTSKKIQALILGCTHYPLLKKVAEENLGKYVAVISQDEIIPKRLELYLKKHPEIENKLSKKSSHIFLVSKLNENFNKVAKSLFKEKIKLNLI